jgi:sugar/nucleoside kinase (ribokinase family)
MKPLDVLTVADMCVDLMLAGNVRPQFHQVEQIIGDYFVELGGSANIFATQMAKLEVRVGVIGWVGGDAFGPFLIEKLRAAGVDVSRVRTHPTLKTGLGVALTEPEDRAILTYLGTIDATRAEDLPEDPASASRHWHLASYFLLAALRPYWKRWISRCKQAGLTVSLDTNWDPEDRWEGVLDLLPLIDVFLPNDAEASRLTGESDVREAGKRLGRMCPVVVIKRGKKGALAIRDGKVWEIRPEDFHSQPVEVIDSVGAGDNFDAGFIRGWLLGAPVEECLELAHRCAVASLRARGGIEGQLREPVRGERGSL